MQRSYFSTIKFSSTLLYIYMYMCVYNLERSLSNVFVVYILHMYVWKHLFICRCVYLLTILLDNMVSTFSIRRALYNRLRHQGEEWATPLDFALVVPAPPTSSGRALRMVECQWNCSKFLTLFCLKPLDWRFPSKYKESKRLD